MENGSAFAYAYLYFQCALLIRRSCCLLVKWTLLANTCMQNVSLNFLSSPTPIWSEIKTSKDEQFPIEGNISIIINDDSFFCTQPAHVLLAVLNKSLLFNRIKWRTIFEYWKYLFVTFATFGIVGMETSARRILRYCQNNIWLKKANNKIRTSKSRWG